MDIRVYCKKCGTELETPDAACDLLLQIAIQAEPCPKCCRPPNCQKTCEDVTKLMTEIVELKQELEKKCPKGLTLRTDDCLNCQMQLTCKVRGCVH